jgi:hypothetical protein
MVGCGRPRTTPLRAVMNAIFYLAQSGCQWRLLPKDFPPYTTVQHYFYPWRDSGLWRQINHSWSDGSPFTGTIARNQAPYYCDSGLFALDANHNLIVNGSLAADSGTTQNVTIVATQ